MSRVVTAHAGYNRLQQLGSDMPALMNHPGLAGRVAIPLSTFQLAANFSALVRIAMNVDIKMPCLEGIVLRIG